MDEASKSETFVKLVAPGDKDVAAELIKTPQKQKDWERALASIKNIQHFLDKTGPIFIAIEEHRGRRYIYWDNLKILWQQVLGGFQDNVFEGVKYEAYINRWLEGIQKAGLKDTADYWQRKLLDFFLSYLAFAVFNI